MLPRSLSVCSRLLALTLKLEVQAVTRQALDCLFIPQQISVEGDRGTPGSNGGVNREMEAEFPWGRETGEIGKIFRNIARNRDIPQRQKPLPGSHYTEGRRPGVQFAGRGKTTGPD